MEEHPQARIVVETLHRAGFVAYYAGGWVRDFILKHPSDDIDIATNAPPETVQALFSHTVPLGISFGIVLVIQDGHPYEVATFRQDLDYKDGRRPSRIEFTTAAEDAKRRDFTINGLFYDPIRQEILDYVNGRSDIEAGIIRAIGNPHERIKEDRLRMIRGIRLACRFGFQIEKNTEEAIRAHAKELFPAVAIERIVQEFSKGHAFGKLQPMLSMLHQYGLLGSIFPELAPIAQNEIDHRLDALARYPKTAPLIAFLLALFPGFTLQQQLELCKKLKLSNHDAEIVAYLFRARQLVDEEFRQSRTIENVEWAYFYAHPFCLLALQIIAAHIERGRAKKFLQAHEERQKNLRRAIECIQHHSPVVTSAELMQAKIKPGKEMGALLKEAERIAFNEQVYDPKPIIEQLRRSPIWPKNLSN
jgi:poly(A) polymerase